MSDESIFTDDHMKGAAEYPGLGPVYFATDDLAAEIEGAVSKIDLSAAVRQFSDAAYEAILNSVEKHLAWDARTNVAGEMQRMVDGAISALLSGKQWALNQYVLSGKHSDGEAIRKAIAEHLPDTVARARIADLEAQVESLEKSLRWARGDYS